jgi:tripartite-type tricarboxylate transporter receptor subunit TctC
MNIPRLLAAIVAAALTALAPARAQDWPSRPVHVIVPFAAGGSTDVAARLVGEYVSRTLGQRFLVENRTGANGNVALDAVAKSPPDGYTIMVATDVLASNPHVYKVPYDSLKDFTPVIQLSRQPVVIAVHPSLGVGSLGELVELAKRDPGMGFGTGSGLGSSQSMVMLWFARIANIKLEQVAYRGGGQAINDLLGGHIKLGSLGSTPVISHYRAGALKLLAQSTATRSASLPDVPTFAEAGIEGLVYEQWIGVVVPAGTPAAIVARLNTEIDKALQDPAIRASFLESAQDPVGGSADAFAQLMRHDFTTFEKLVKELGIKVE